MASILLAIAAMCNVPDLLYPEKCQKHLVLCVRDKIQQSPGGKTRTDEYLWECTVEKMDKK